MCSHLYPVCLVSRTHISRNTFPCSLPNIAFAIWKTRLMDLHYVQCLNSPNGKSMVYGPNGKGIMALIEYTLIIYGPSGKSMVLWNIIFPRGMIKDKKWCTMKDTMSIKISFTHYRNYIAWTTVKLPVVFEEFDMFFFWFLVSFHYYCQLLNGQL